MSLEYLGVKDAVSNRVATQGELGGGSTYTSSSGITLTGSNFTNDLITGKSGGQTISLDTVSGGIGTITSTTNATKGKITIGALTIDEANARIGIGTGSPVAGYALDVGGFRSTSKTFVSLSPNAYSGNATLEIGGQGSFTGGANDFNGSSSGTTLGINEASGFAGDFINCQKIGVSYFKVSNTGGVIVGASTTAQASLNIPSGTAPTTPVNGNLYFAGGHLMFTTGGSSYQLDQQGSTGLTLITGTATISFPAASSGYEDEWAVTTVASATILNASIKTVAIVPLNTNSDHPDFDDFSWDGLQFNIENIIDNTSFDIRAVAANNTFGNYDVKYTIGQ